MADKMQISDLPDDILHQVFPHIHGEASLYALALANCRFHIVDLRRSWPGSSSLRKLELFQRSVQERPNIGPLVHHLRLGWRDDNERMARENSHRAKELLAKLPSLRSLALEGGNAECHQFNLGFLEVYPIPLLHTVTLYDKCTTINDILQFMQLENVDNIHVNTLNTHAENKALVGRTQRRATQLLTLDLNCFFHVPAEMLAQLVEQTTALQVLQCNIPGREQITGARFFNKRMNSPVSPARAASALGPIQDTLVRLIIGECTGTDWPYHDGSQLDLSQFKALRNLNVQEKCLFHVKGPDPSRNGVFKLLPATLQEFNVRN